MDGTRKATQLLIEKETVKRKYWPKMGRAASKNVKKFLKNLKTSVWKNKKCSKQCMTKTWQNLRCHRVMETVMH